jgi:hypothetical protein
MEQLGELISLWLTFLEIEFEFFKVLISINQGIENAFLNKSIRLKE